jgi:hypothetical protein
MDRVAGAAELPVLGALFRSRQFRDRQTELVVFITPRFVEGAAMPAAAAAIRTEPVREPSRLLPELPTVTVEPAALDGMPADVGVAAARPAGPGPGVGVGRLRPAERGAGSPATTESPAPAEPSASSAMAPMTPITPSTPSRPTTPASPAPPAVLDGEDRGTAGRWRATRERVRMVD